MCDAGTAASVLCERPSSGREPLPADTSTAIWLAMGAAVLMLAVLAALHWLKKPKPTGRENR